MKERVKKLCEKLTSMEIRIKRFEEFIQRFIGTTGNELIELAKLVRNRRLEELNQGGRRQRK